MKAVNQLVGAPVESHVLLQCLVEVFPKPMNGWYRNDGECRVSCANRLCCLPSLLAIHPIPNIVYPMFDKSPFAAAMYTICFWRVPPICCFLADAHPDIITFFLSTQANNTVLDRSLVVAVIFFFAFTFASDIFPSPIRIHSSLYIFLLAVHSRIGNGAFVSIRLFA